MPRVIRPRALTALMCAYLGLTVLGFHGVAALLPGFMDLWHLSETEAGWLLGVMSLCSLLASPKSRRTRPISSRRSRPLRSTASSAAVSCAAGRGRNSKMASATRASTSSTITAIRRVSEDMLKSL